MGKGDKKFKKKWKKFGKHKRKHRELYDSRADMLLSLYPSEVLDIWYKSNEEKKSFGQWLVEQESYYSDDSLDILNDTSEEDRLYEKKINKLQNHRCKDMVDMIITGYRISDTYQKQRKGKKLKKLRNKDLGIATYMNSSRYRKSYLNNDEYRKCLKKIAKQEQREFKEMEKLGYIHRNDPDDELKKLLKANSRMTEALSDSYIQKHYLK